MTDGKRTEEPFPTIDREEKSISVRVWAKRPPGKDPNPGPRSDKEFRGEGRREKIQNPRVSKKTRPWDPRRLKVQVEGLLARKRRSVKKSSLREKGGYPGGGSAAQDDKNKKGHSHGEYWGGSTNVEAEKAFLDEKRRP